MSRTRASRVVTVGRRRRSSRTRRCRSCCLIEPLFAVLNEVFGKNARAGITTATMVNGQAGMIYVPSIGRPIPLLEWRATRGVRGDRGFSDPLA